MFTRDMIKLKNNIDAVRKKRGMTIDALAQFSGISSTYLKQIKKNSDKIKRLNEEAIESLCNALRCNPGDLLTLEEPFPSASPDTPTPGIDEALYADAIEYVTLWSRDEHPPLDPVTFAYYVMKIYNWGIEERQKKGAHAQPDAIQWAKRLAHEARPPARQSAQPVVTHPSEKETTT